MKESTREIAVSTGVFARIWALRHEGENSENEILSRLLFDKPVSESGTGSRGAGFHDVRHGVSFPEGFEIFRTYKNRDYRARASSGGWKLLGRSGEFRSLNQLSRAIGAVTENAWQNWMYLTEMGLRRPVSDFRTSHRETNTSARPEQEADSMNTWRSDVELALRQLGTVASLSEIYDVVRKVRQSFGRSLPPSSDAIVRRTLEENCAETDSYKGLFNLFWMPDGKGAGRWALR